MSRGVAVAFKPKGQPSYKLSNKDIDRLQKAMDRAIADNDYQAQRRIARELLQADE